jgi:hypothetical protein
MARKSESFDEEYRDEEEEQEGAVVNSDLLDRVGTKENVELQSEKTNKTEKAQQEKKEIRRELN